MKRSFLSRIILLSGLVAVGLAWSCTPEEVEALTSPPATSDTGKPEDNNTNNKPSGIPEFNETKAFPTAEGFGRFSRGGRGGKTIYVTSLKDTKEQGTLRYALEVAKGPRNVLFKISGIIELTKNIKITDPYVTIAGQTAPGTGITLKNAGIQIETHDIIMRHMKIRPGDSRNGEEPSDRDCIVVFKDRNCHNLMFDQLSLTWAIDENISFSTGTNNSTLQNTIIAEGLSHSLHDKGEHSKGLLMLNNLDNISIINNLFAHNMNRNPLLSSNSRNIHVVNNLIYNWGPMKAGYGTHSQIFDDELPINDAVIYRNVYRRGKTSHDLPLYRTGNWFLVDVSTLYIDDNYMDTDGKLSSLKDISTSYKSYPDFFAKFTMKSAPRNWQEPYSKIVTADKVVEKVLATVGARVPILDEVDTRIISEARNFTGDFVDSPRAIGGYPQQQQGNAPTDSDGDGMPDKWELERGLDPQSALDGPENTLSSYYTNLEVYLNELAGDYEI